MRDQNTDLVDRFRAECASRGLPSEQVEARIRLARPAIYAAEGDEGRLVARMGGDAELPQDVPLPGAQFVADIDCAQLPPGATDIPLPADGRLLLFAEPDVSAGGTYPGLVIYVPAGTPTFPRPSDGDWPKPYPERQMRTLWHQPCWPEEDEEDYETVDKLESAWSHVVGWRPDWTLQIGGHPNTVNWDPVEAARQENAGTDGEADAGDWILLATWSYGQDLRDYLDLGLIHWSIRRRDLAALRFDRVCLDVDMM